MHLLLLLPLSVMCYPKSDRMDARFPPMGEGRRYIGVPTGHLRPLGWQCPLEGRVAELPVWPSPSQFDAEHARVWSAVVLRSVAADWPLLDDQQLVDGYGSYPLELRQSGRVAVEQQTLRSFVARYRHDDWFAYGPIPANLTRLVPFPPALDCAPITHALIQPAMWLSFGHTYTPLAYETFNQLRCLVSGRQDYILVPVMKRGELDFDDVDVGSGMARSPVDVEMVNVYRHAALETLPWLWTTLRAGDCLYIPTGAPYQLRAYGRALAYHVQWAGEYETSHSSCTDEMTAGVLMRDYDWLWTLNDTGKELSRGSPAFGSADWMRSALGTLLGADGNDDAVTGSVFAHFARLASKGQLSTPSRLLFQALTDNDVEDDVIITRDDLIAMTEEKLETLASLITGLPLERKRDEL